MPRGSTPPHMYVHIDMEKFMFKYGEKEEKEEEEEMVHD